MLRTGGQATMAQLVCIGNVCCGTALWNSVVEQHVADLKLLSNSSQNDDRTSRWHCKRIVTLVLATALAVSSDGCSIAVGLDKKSLQIFKCLSKFVDLRLQRQTKFVEPLIAWRPYGQDLSAHDLLVFKKAAFKS